MVFRNRKKTTRVADVLHGCTPGRIQSVGYMQVIPLVSELSDDRFVSPIEGEAEVFTTSYGTLGFRNTGDSRSDRSLPRGVRGQAGCPGPRYGARRRGPVDRPAVVRYGHVHPTVAGRSDRARLIQDADPAVCAAGAGFGGAQGKELQQALGRYLAVQPTKWESRVTVTWNTS